MEKQIQNNSSSDSTTSNSPDVPKYFENVSQKTPTRETPKNTASQETNSVSPFQDEKLSKLDFDFCIFWGVSLTL